MGSIPSYGVPHPVRCGGVVLRALRLRPGEAPAPSPGPDGVASACLGLQKDTTPGGSENVYDGHGMAAHAALSRRHPGAGARTRSPPVRRQALRVGRGRCAAAADARHRSGTAHFRRAFDSGQLHGELEGHRPGRVHHGRAELRNRLVRGGAGHRARGRCRAHPRRGDRRTLRTHRRPQPRGRRGRRTRHRGHEPARSRPDAARRTPQGGAGNRAGQGARSRRTRAGTRRGCRTAVAGQHRTPAGRAPGVAAAADPASGSRVRAPRSCWTRARTGEDPAVLPDPSRSEDRWQGGNFGSPRVDERAESDRLLVGRGWSSSL